MNWLKKAATKAVRLVKDKWRAVADILLERERLRQIRKREELGDL